MTAQECSQQVVAKVLPVLNELGFEAFVFAAYHRTHDENGKDIVSKQVIVYGGNNVPMQDGLLPMVVAAQRWNPNGT